MQHQGGGDTGNTRANRRHSAWLLGLNNTALQNGMSASESKLTGVAASDVAAVARDRGNVGGVGDAVDQAFAEQAKVSRFQLDYVLSQNEYVLAIVAFVVFFAFWMLRQSGQPKAQLMFVLFCAWLAFSKLYVWRTEAKDHLAVATQFAEMERGRLHQTGLVFRNSVDVSETPMKHVHMRRREDVMRLVNMLHVYAAFDFGAVTAVLTLLERFFQIYDKLMLGEATCVQSFESLKDVRTEAMNQLSAMAFNIPPEEVHEIAIITRRLQAKTARYVKIASRKCDATSIPDGFFDYGSPAGFDATKLPHELY